MFSYLFWADPELATVERSSMDGSSRRVLVSGGPDVGRPAGLCVDRAGRRLYWTDPDHGRVVSSDYSGSNVIGYTLPTSINSSILGIAIYQVGGRVEECFSYCRLFSFNVTE